MSMAVGSSCPACGSTVSSTMTACPNCGAKLDSSEEDLVEALDDLETTAVADELVGMSEEVDAAARHGDVAVGAVAEVDSDVASDEAGPRAVGPDVRGEQADLSAFVARVEQNVKARARLAPPPRPSRAAPLLVASGVITGAAGLFLFPADRLVGLLTLLSGLVFFILGASVRLAGLRA